MLSKEGLEFLLKITDYFHGHWEDPEWGRRPINQLLILLASHTFANAIEEAETRTQVQTTVEKAMAEVAVQVTKA